MRNVYLALMAFTVISTIPRDLWRRFPAFVIYMLVGIGITIAYSPTEMPDDQWVAWQIVLVMLRFACCAEVLRMMVHVPNFVMVWSLTLPAALVASVATALSGKTHMAMMSESLVGFDAVVIFCLIFYLLVSLAGVDLPRRMPVVHSFIFIGMMGNQIACFVAFHRIHTETALTISYSVLAVLLACACLNFLTSEEQGDAWAADARVLSGLHRVAHAHEREALDREQHL